MRLRATFRKSKSSRRESENEQQSERETRLFNSQEVFKAYYSSETNFRQLTYEYTCEYVDTSYENCTTEESRTRQFEHFLSVKC